MAAGHGGSWSAAKLACVEDYVRAYLKVMQKQSWCRLHYVDAFAGSGRHQVKQAGARIDWPSLFDTDEMTEAEDFVAGSPIRALRASHEATRGFDAFTFIEMSQRKNRVLRSAVDASYPNESQRAAFLVGDANEHLLSYVAAQDWIPTRAVVFLDPFGLEVRWDTVVALAETKACDVWYLFPLGVQRMMKKDGAISDAWSARLDTVFGTHGWYDEFYQPDPQESLFPEDEGTVREASTQHVTDYIVARLGSVFVGGVSKPAVLRFSNGAPFAALVMAVGNPKSAAKDTALRIANSLTEKLGRA